ncbi:serine/threonine-protein kinase PAK 4-like [Penaeus monodon]|uniref:serine/threonine-protein kinase PAK 4-like n=1 Tax=Penaeus monodon TaxID=6687 RepID=UPI0018A6E952|nr:serine/threonine-protein kinase PAK 4-like [Penaeus monodon]
MEYLGPYNLTDIVRHRMIRTDRECYELMLSLSRQVQELNACGIVHADLKHNNIMVTYDGAKPVAHLIDFGFSTKIGQKSHIGYYCVDWEHEL